MKKQLISSSEFAESLRRRVLVPETRHLLITDFRGSKQSQDLSVPPNCRGYGRVRHFRRVVNPDWPPDPLPILPASKALGLKVADELSAQVFQLAACNWRCWYCFVDYKLLSADHRYAAFLTPSDMVSLYLQEQDRPLVIDLSGGHPDLAPEWIPWMMQELESRGLSNQTYLWSDDNLSTDFLWRYLSKEEIRLMCGYRNYGRACCFKGFDEASFCFNTNAHPDLFGRQFDLARGLLSLGLDLYCYATFTTPVTHDIREQVARFVDRLQQLDMNLPLRTVPLEIRLYGPQRERFQATPAEVLSNQYRAAEAWVKELTSRYSTEELARPITEVSLETQAVRVA